jgi:hypothetical protein
MSKSKAIIFRVTEEQYAQIEKTTHSSDKAPNDWRSDLALLEAGLESEFSQNERIIF